MNKCSFQILSFLVFVSFECFSQWNVNPSVNTLVSTGSNDQQDVRIVPDTKGGAIITWVDYRNDASQAGVADIYSQRISASGYNLWTTNGISICTNTADQPAFSMIEDGVGGVIITWVDWRNGNKDIYAQRVDSSGNIKWTADGIAVCDKTNPQQGMKVIGDGNEGAIVVWEDSLGGSYDIYAQRISNTGTVLWTAGGVSICALALSQSNPKIDSDGLGGAIIVWQDKRNGADYDIYCQRIDSSGAVQWTANGVIVASTIGTQSNPKLRSDENNGAIISWQDKRSGIDYDIYAQWVNGSGAMQWAANGVVVCNAGGSQSAIDMTDEGISGGVIISWKDLRSGVSDIYAQKVDTNGAVQWASNGVAVTTANYPQVNPNAVGDGSGGAIIVWQDSVGGSWDIYSQKLNSGGIIQWPVNGVAVGTASNDQLSAKNISDGTGGCIYAWQDKRNTLDYDIYAHRILSDGTAAGIPDFSAGYNAVICYPNPFSETAMLLIRENNYAKDLELNVYNIFGEKLKISSSCTSNGFVINRETLESGIYFYEIKSSANNFIYKGKLSIID